MQSDHLWTCDSWYPWQTINNMLISSGGEVGYWETEDLPNSKKLSLSGIFSNHPRLPFCLFSKKKTLVCSYTYSPIPPLSQHGFLQPPSWAAMPLASCLCGRSRAWGGLPPFFYKCNEKEKKIPPGLPHFNRGLQYNFFNIYIFLYLINI